MSTIDTVVIEQLTLRRDWLRAKTLYVNHEYYFFSKNPSSKSSSSGSSISSPRGK